MFSEFLEKCPDVVAFARNLDAEAAGYFSVKYEDSDRVVRRYVPDFFVRVLSGAVFVVETKGVYDSKIKYKMERLRQQMAGIRRSREEGEFHFVFVDG